MNFPLPASVSDSHEILRSDSFGASHGQPCSDASLSAQRAAPPQLAGTQHRQAIIGILVDNECWVRKSRARLMGTTRAARPQQVVS
jgi:hypothetical protein